MSGGSKGADLTTLKWFNAGGGIHPLPVQCAWRRWFNVGGDLHLINFQKYTHIFIQKWFYEHVILL